MRSHAAVVRAVGTAARRQQDLRLRQLQRARARNQQHHPAKQKAGDPPLHIRSLHAGADTLSS